MAARGRKVHEPTKAQRDTVSLHAMVGTPHDTISEILNIDPKTLRKHYRSELDHAMAKANATIGGSLFNKAKGGDTAAQIFWMKTRAGFKEVKGIEMDHSSSDGSMTPTKITRVIVDPKDIDDEE
jgi:hypothetical protein